MYAELMPKLGMLLGCALVAYTAPFVVGFCTLSNITMGERNRRLFTAGVIMIVAYVIG